MNDLSQGAEHTDASRLPYTNEHDVTKNVSKSGLTWKKILIVGLIVVCFSGIAYWVLPRMKSNPPNLTEMPTIEETKKDTALIIDTGNLTREDSLIHIPISINTGVNSVSAVEVHVRISPIPKKIISIKPDTFFPNAQVLDSSVDQTTGIVSLIVGSSKPMSGTGTLATITIQNEQNSLLGTTLTFTGRTRAAATDEKNTVIKELLAGTISK